LYKLTRYIDMSRASVFSHDAVFVTCFNITDGAARQSKASSAGLRMHGSRRRQKSAREN